MILGLTRVGPSSHVPTFLAYVALHGGGSRSAIAERLWPDSDHARSNLRVELHRLERGPYAGAVTATTADVHLADGVTSDVSVARSLAETDPGAALERVGPVLLPWLGSDGAAANPWLIGQRSQWSAYWTGLVRRAVRQVEDAGDLAAARTTLDTWVAAAPEDEEPRRELLRLAVTAGDEPAAEAAWAAVRDMTRTRLGRDPAPETKAWHARLHRTDPVSDAPWPYVGRQRVLESLAGRISVIEGPAGWGVSALLREACARNGRSLMVEARASAAPYLSLGVALGRVANRSPRARAAVAALAARTATVREAVLSGLVEYIGHQGLLAIDDLVDLDTESISVLRDYLDAITRLPVEARPAVVMGVRRGAASGTAADGLLAVFRSRNLLRTISLEPLGERDLTSLLGQILGRRPATDDVQALLEVTDGVPAHVRSTITEWRRRGTMGTREDGRGPVSRRGALDPVPDVIDSVRNSMAQLPSLAVTLASLLTLAPGPVSATALARAGGVGEWDALAAIQCLEDAGLAVVGDSGCALTSLVRAVVRGSLPPHRLEILARTLGAALYATGAPLVTVATCYELGGCRTEAGQSWSEAGDLARRESRTEDAVEAYGRALGFGLDAPTEVRVRTAIFDLESVLGHDDLARQQMAPIRTLMEAVTSQRPRFDVREAAVHLRDGAYEAALTVVERLLAGDVDDAVRTEALHIRGLCRYAQGSFENAEADLRQARRLDPGDHTRRSAEAARALVRIALTQGDLATAAAEARELERLTSLLGYPEAVASTALTLGTMAAMSGDYGMQQVRFQTALDVATAAGLGTLAAEAEVGLAGHALAHYRHDEAVRRYTAALTALPESRRPVALANLGSAAFMSGRIGASFDALNEALAIADARGERAIRCRRVLTLAEMRLRAGCPVPDADLAAVQSTLHELGSTTFDRYIATLRLHAAVVAGEPFDDHEAVVRSQEPAGDESERHWYTLALAALAAGARKEVLACAAHDPDEPRLRVLRGFADPGNLADQPPDHSPAVDRLLWAHSRVLAGMDDVTVRDAHLSELEAGWPDHGGALERLLQRFTDWTVALA
jgi:DNA-binding SARP family transcriptional activator/tetratricopeptide (TPR) repeat protein